MKQFLRAVIVFSIICSPALHAEEFFDPELETANLLSEIPALLEDVDDAPVFSYLPAIQTQWDLQSVNNGLINLSQQLQASIEQNKADLLSGRILVKSPQALGAWFYALLAGSLFLGMLIGRLLPRKRRPEAAVIEGRQEEKILVEEDSSTVPIMKSKAALDTMLDLSQTYSNDAPTAKQFLDEVLQYGDELQKQRAKELENALIP